MGMNSTMASKKPKIMTFWLPMRSPNDPNLGAAINVAIPGTAATTPLKKSDRG